MQGVNMRRGLVASLRVCAIFALAPVWALAGLIELIARGIGWATSYPVDWAASEIERQVQALRDDLMPGAE